MDTDFPASSGVCGIRQEALPMRRTKRLALFPLPVSWQHNHSFRRCSSRHVPGHGAARPVAASMT